MVVTTTKHKEKEMEKTKSDYPLSNICMSCHEKRQIREGQKQKIKKDRDDRMTSQLTPSSFLLWFDHMNAQEPHLRSTPGRFEILRKQWTTMPIGVKAKWQKDNSTKATC
jgi:hypothetical protein